MPCFALLVCTAFALHIKLFISAHEFSHFYSSNSLPHPTAEGVSCVVLHCWLGLNHHKVSCYTFSHFTVEGLRGCSKNSSSRYYELHGKKNSLCAAAKFKRLPSKYEYNSSKHKQINVSINISIFIAV